jgi:hypothetical protein
LIKGFNSLHEAHEEESRGHEDRYQRSSLGHPGLWPPVALGRTGFAGGGSRPLPGAAMVAAREGMPTVDRGPFAPFVHPQGAFVFFVEIVVRLKLADNQVK